MDAMVTERPELNRFELALEGGTAIATYRGEGERLVLDHTEVPEPLRGRGIGTRLAKGVFELARASGRRLVPLCPFMKDFADRHPEYRDIVES